MTVRVTKLDNGMRVATDAMATVETVTLGAWVETGARDEAPEINGISHLLEHMVFKGTERRSARAIAEELGVGAGKVIHPTRVAMSAHAKSAIWWRGSLCL